MAAMMMTAPRPTIWVLPPIWSLTCPNPPQSSKLFRRHYCPGGYQNALFCRCGRIARLETEYAAQSA
ncbi:MAG: hypothetical protein ACRDOH_33800, partial [Streptosporangiaceae bacterium]